MHRCFLYHLKSAINSMKKILPILLVLFIIVFFVLTLVIPGFAKSAARKRTELRLLQSEEKIIPETKALLSSKKEQITMLEESFPSKENLISVVQYFDSQAAASGVSADLHFVGEDLTQDQNGDTIVAVEITIEGAYANVLAFLDSLQKGKYLYGITSIQGDAPSGLGAKNKLVVKANLYASK